MSLKLTFSSGLTKSDINEVTCRVAEYSSYSYNRIVESDGTKCNLTAI